MQAFKKKAVQGLKWTALVAAMLTAQSASAGLIDLGAAKDYSAFILGNVTVANDIEGRLAVAGNLTTNGLSINYRTPNNYANQPALVVGGNVTYNNGNIYSTAPAGVDSTKGMFTPWWDPSFANYKASFGVYGGSNVGSSSYLDLRKQSNYLDFAGAAATLTATSNMLMRRSPQAPSAMACSRARTAISRYSTSRRAT